MDQECLMEDNSVSETMLNDSDTAGSTSNPMPVNPSVCNGKCCDVVQPVQIRDKDAIQSTRKLQGKKWRQFSPDWYKSFPWLVLCTTRSKALCSYCSSCHRRGLLTEKVAGGGDTFLTTGFNNWKKATEYFLQHEKSVIHRESVLKLELMKQPTITAQLSSQAKREQKENRDMLLKQLSSLRYLARQGLAIRGHSENEGNLMQLLLLRCEDNPLLKQWLVAKKYLSHDILNEQIGLMANHMLRKLLQEIREATVYALIADEATDVSHKEQLCITIRWVDNDFLFHEDPIELINVPRTDSATLTASIKDSLVRFCLPIGQCRGQAYDGASNMLGHINGVAACMQKEEPSAIYVHCLAHCINLCLQVLGRQVAPVRDSLELVREVSQLIRFSPKRLSLFESMQSQLSHSSPSPSLKPLCPTRWTVRTGAINAVLANYEVLCDALCKIHAEGRDEYAMKAGGILHAMEKFCTFFGLHLSHLVFSATEQLSLSLQGKDTTVQEAIQASNLALNYLERQRSDEAFNYFYDRLTETSKELTSEPSLPRYARRPRRIDDGEPSHRFETPKSYFRQQYFELFDLASGELKRRFQQNGLPVAATVEKLLLEAANATLSDSIDIEKELALYAKDVDIPHLKLELQMLPDLVKTYNESNHNIRTVTNLRTIADLLQTVSNSKVFFREVYKLTRIFFPFPITIATAERTFSTLRRLKTFLRSTQKLQKSL